MRDERVLVEIGAVAQDDPGGHLLAPLLTRHAGRRSFGNGRVLLEDRLDLARVHRHAAGDDQLLAAPFDHELARAVEAAEVAGAKPIVIGEGGLAPEVALEDLWAAHLDLAVLRQPHQHARQRHADGAGPRLAVDLRHVEP